MSARARAWGIGVAVVLVAASMEPCAARAQVDDLALPLELVWSAPEGCPDANAVREELARIVVIEPGRVPSLLRAAGEVVRAGTSFRLALRTEREGDEGRRTLVASSCGDLLRAATLVLALAYGEGVALRTDEPEPAPVARVEAHATPVPIPSPEAPHSVRATIGIELGAAAGVLPEPSFEGAITAEIGEPWWRVRVRAAVSPGAPTRVNESAEASFLALGAGLEACGGAPVDVLRGEVCAGVVTSALHGEARGTTVDRDAWAPLVALRAALGIAIGVGAVELRLVGSVAWNTSRPRFEVVGLGTVHRVGEIAISGALGIAFSP